jgi:hypothetical protein
MEFSDLAMVKLLQVLPELGPYIVTFKDVTDELNREGDETQVGLFIVSFGGQYYYIPITGKGEVLQPVDSIFDPTEGCFYPLTKSFLQKFINSQSLQLGNRTKIPQTVVQNPSVYGLVTPPRTGKFNYASESRVTEFLSILPPLTKKAFIEGVYRNKPFAENLNKMFGLSNIVESLSTSPAITKSASAETPLTDNMVEEMGIHVITGGEGLNDTEIQSILTKGYALRGIQKEVRIAVPAYDGNRYGSLQSISSVDQGLEFDIVMKNGETREGLVMRRSSILPQMALLLSRSASANFILFSNGDYTTKANVIGVAQGTNTNNVFKSIFQYSPPITASQLVDGDKAMLLTPDLEFVGAFRINRTESHSLGITIKGYNLVSQESVVMHAYKNCKQISAPNRSEIYIPSDAVFVRLNDDLDYELEVNINSAQARLELNSLVTLGGMSTIGYDGVEFSYNGSRVGNIPSLLTVLITTEGLPPKQAEEFIKRAQETRTCRFYISKKADFEPAEIPQYGNIPPEQPNSQGLGERQIGNMQEASETGDMETTGAMILSELLQVPSMDEYITEYLPEIKGAIDKLGRILFLARINMSKMFTGENASDIFSFLASLRNVYRLLGDNYIKLERMAQSIDEQQQIAQQEV